MPHLLHDRGAAEQRLAAGLRAAGREGLCPYTGTDPRPEDLAEARWALPRQTYLHETALPGMFAVGEVRAASIKRVATAVGEGSNCPAARRYTGC